MTSFFSNIFGRTNAPVGTPRMSQMERAILSGDTAVLAFIANQAHKAPQSSQGSRPPR